MANAAIKAHLKSLEYPREEAYVFLSLFGLFFAFFLPLSFFLFVYKRGMKECRDAKSESRKNQVIRRKRKGKREEEVTQILHPLPLSLFPSSPRFPGVAIVPRRGRQGPKEYAPGGSAKEARKLELTLEEYRLVHQCERMVAQYVSLSLSVSLSLTQSLTISHNRSLPFSLYVILPLWK